MLINNYYSHFKFKRSRAEQITNVIMLMQLILLLVLIITFAIGNYFWSSNRSQYEYLFYGVDNFPFFAFKAFLSYYLLFNQLIPLSLVISTEIVKIIQTIAIAFDANFYATDRD